MSTTTIRLPDELKARIATAAERSGNTAHSYILDAISEKIEHDEQLDQFHAIADARYANIVATGKTIPWDDMRHYLEERIAGRKAVRPVAKKMAR